MDPGSTVRCAPWRGRALIRGVADARGRECRRRPLHGKLTVALLGASVVLNAMLVLYIINLSFMRPLEFDREGELAK